jgi:hypothetical protein
VWRLTLPPGTSVETRSFFSASNPSASGRERSAQNRNETGLGPPWRSPLALPAGRGGAAALGVLGAASGLLFAVILKHNQLRTVVGSPGVSYIEVIPILLYSVIVVVVLNAILLASPYTVKFVHYRSNLVPVLAYWPVVLGLLFGLTLVVFFLS